MRELVNIEFDLISGGFAWQQLEPVEISPEPASIEPISPTLPMPKSTGPEYFYQDTDGDGFGDLLWYRQPDGSYF